MSKPDDGGPAFPGNGEFFVDGPQGRMAQSAWGMDGGKGMSLRDHFAGKAMQGIVGSIDGELCYMRLKEHAARDGLSVSQWIARDSYKQADAMIAERQKGGSDGR